MRSAYSLDNETDSTNLNLSSSLHGNDSLGLYDAEKTKREVLGITTDLLQLLAIQDNNYRKIDDRLKDKKEYVFWAKKGNWPANNSPAYSKLDKVPQTSSFFIFVPMISKNKKVSYVRSGGPEIMDFLFKNKTVAVDSLERENLASLHSFDSSETGVRNILSETYPLVLNSDNNASTGDILPTDVSQSFNSFAKSMIERIVDSAIEKINAQGVSETQKADFVNLLAMFLDACINKSNVADVADGIATGITNRLKSDFENARSKAFSKYEFKRNDGTYYSEFIDIDSKRFFEAHPLKEADLSVFKTSLTEAIKADINERWLMLSKVYKDLLRFDETRQANRAVERLRNRLRELENSVLEDKSSIGTDQTIKDLENSVKTLKASLLQKDREVQNLKTQEEAIQVNTNMSIQPRENPGDDHRTTGMVAKIAVASLVAGGIFWLVNHKK